jgi:PAS domain S-box-containing protein
MPTRITALTGAPATTADLQRRARLYEAILSATPDLVYVFDLDHRFTYANQALLDMWGKTWTEAIGKNCLELGYEPWHAEMHDREIDDVIASKKPIRGEVPFTGVNGTRIYDYIFVPVYDDEGNFEAVAGTTRDVTERKEFEREQELFAGELQHRVKNTLAVVRAIAQQTFGGSPKFNDFSGRVVSLGKGLDVLVQKSWAAAPLRELLQTILAAHESVDSGRVQFDGPDFMVRPRSVVALSLALNELATNALKYGALSNGAGALAIAWTVEGGRFRLTWTESGGPEVREPEKKGFGSRLIEQSLAQEIGGGVVVHYLPAGVVCVIDASLDAIATEPPQRSGA